MAEQLKFLYNEDIINKLSDEILIHYKDFNKNGFKNKVFNKEWKDKELKERMRHITVTLRDFLPKDYVVALNILKDTSNVIKDGFAPMFFPDFVEVYGLDYYEESIKALEHFTKTSSSEFAIRPFIIKYENKVMKQMTEWADSDNYHVRRLATEGCRPRLPWAIGLPAFKTDPTLVIEILNKLKDDPEEYVRRSVANNLNDISKDHPDVIVDLSKEWLNKDKNRRWLVKHANRGLLKKGDVKTLSLFGFKAPDNIGIKGFSLTREVLLMEDLNFEFDLNTTKENLGKLRVEFAIYFMKKSGKNAKKVFSISESVISGNSKKIQKKFSFKNITTRKYYTGIHYLSIIINGVELEKKIFILKENP